MKLNIKISAVALIAILATPLVHAVDTAPVKPHSYTEIAPQPTDVKDREIAALFERWNRTLQTGDSAKVTALYAKNAILQPTVSNKVRTTPAEIKDYFDHFLVLKPVGVVNFREIRRLNENKALDTCVYTFTLTEADGSKRQVLARYTYLYQKINGEWLILNHHSSAMPQQG